MKTKFEGIATAGDQLGQTLHGVISVLRETLARLAADLLPAQFGGFRGRQQIPKGYHEADKPPGRVVGRPFTQIRPRRVING
jgi:hypothetical protein